MGFEGTEHAAERDVLFRGQVLVAEDENSVFGQRLPELFDGLVGHGGRKIDVRDLCTDHRRHLFQRNRQGRISSPEPEGVELGIQQRKAYTHRSPRQLP